MLRDDRFFHVLPNLAVRDEPQVWRDVLKLLEGNGLTRAEALRRVRFAYTGSFTGQLPPGV